MAGRQADDGRVAGRTVLVVGLGAIGLEVARLAAAFGMRVLGVKRTPGAVPGVDEVGPPERIAELAARRGRRSS